MYVIVVGAGDVGYELAKTLLRGDHEVSIIESSQERCDAVNEELGSLVLAGRGSDEAVLKEAGASRAEVFIAVTGSDPDNLAACQMARHRFRVPRTISLVSNAGNEPLFRELGIDVCISSTDVILSRIEEELPRNPLVHIMGIKGSNREVVSIRIPPDAEVIGKSLGEVSVPPDSVISCILKRDGTLHAPDADIVLQSEDELVIITTLEQEEALREVLTWVE